MFVVKSDHYFNPHSKQLDFCCHASICNKCTPCSISCKNDVFTVNCINNKFSTVNTSIITNEPTITDKPIITDESIITDEPIIIDSSTIMANTSVSSDYVTINELIVNNKSTSNNFVVRELVLEYVDQIISELSSNFDTKLQVKDNLIDNGDKIDDVSMNSTSKKIIFAIDNDECIGSWADLSLLYVILKIELGHEPDVDLFVDIMVKTGCIRPYVRIFFDKLLELKKEGIIYKIFMFTAASNSCGWVTYLYKILERWIGHSFYDGIIYKEMIEEWHIFNKSSYFNELGYIKNMNMIRELIDFEDEIDSTNFNFVAIDDRPANIINGIAIGVSAFKIAINIMEVLRAFLPDKLDYLMGKYEKSINSSWEYYLKNPLVFTNVTRDIDFLLSLEHVNKIIYS